MTEVPDGAEDQQNNQLDIGANKTRWKTFFITVNYFFPFANTTQNTQQSLDKKIKIRRKIFAIQFRVINE
jgi:hypothetical protein